MKDKLFTKRERKAVKVLARSMGYSSLQAYLRSLVEMDAKKHGKPIPLNEDILEHPAESFRHAWADAMEGRTMTREEFRQAMEEND
jgi:hypothetical protein